MQKSLLESSPEEIKEAAVSALNRVEFYKAAFQLATAEHKFEEAVFFKLNVLEEMIFAQNAVTSYQLLLIRKEIERLAK